MGLDNSLGMAIVFLDFSKAYDNVNHGLKLNPKNALQPYCLIEVA